MVLVLMIIKVLVIIAENETGAVSYTDRLWR